jgi:S-adenosylmethionine:tRNA ribosyltransferase-isomerase
VRQRHIHTEWVQVQPETVEAISQARAHGGRVLAVGTSTVRALEYAVLQDQLQPCEGPADLSMVPGYQFRAVDALLTNFHLPRTTVLLLAAAFAGRERLLSAYEEALQRRYRFLSFGDAMLIM